MTIMETLNAIDEEDSIDGENIIRSDLSYLSRLTPVVKHFGSLKKALEIADYLRRLGVVNKNFFVDWKTLEKFTDEFYIDYKVRRVD